MVSKRAWEVEVGDVLIYPTQYPEWEVIAVTTGGCVRRTYIAMKNTVGGWERDRSYQPNTKLLAK